ncbi:dethiobiotin synthetase [Gluconobacter japonicus]|uniref:ATP-dependent dethiobiotin synthetase BioD n=1 Tax=Gluconobacter japonicus TaxID=376620 RepID=A0A9Q2FN45_GLUJA|nr:dethiobiotin synthase [Gluconobacter japonicus]KXV39585.1 dethiobiotin synthetase [Gluconobacter japonicus]MBF0870343.1 dethiobiotin synthase [Gluconobacter japonicus]
MNSFRGVFVTGTDTEIGKTLASAILTKAWNATYWKPLQTGLADEAGDTPTVRTLAELTADRIIAPAYGLQAPLAPLAAANLEGVTINPGRLVLPAVQSPLVVEGAGGLMVPIREDMLMIDLIQQMDLPVVLVARSGLGTINHTLLSLEALRRRGIPVLGVVLSGPENSGNARDIERFGNVRILFSVPRLEEINETSVSEIADRVPPFYVCQQQSSQ